MIEPVDAEMSQMVPASQLPGQVRATVEGARRSGRTVVVTEAGEPAGVLLDIDEYRHLVALADRTLLMEDIRRGEEAIAKGDLVDWEEVKRTTLEFLTSG